MTVWVMMVYVRRGIGEVVWSVVVMFETWWDISERKWGCRWSVVSALKIPGSWSKAYCWCLSSLGLRCMCVASEWLANRAHARTSGTKKANQPNIETPIARWSALLSSCQGQPCTSAVGPVSVAISRLSTSSLSLKLGR